MSNLSPDQQQTWDELMTFIRSGETALALSGHAGTGKTFLISRFVTHVRSTGRAVHLTATTNKAARVCSEMGNGAAAGTIHKLLSLIPQNSAQAGKTVLTKKGDGRLIQKALVIIDEASMVGVELLRHILDEVREKKCQVLFVGDAYQLPPVGELDAPVFRLIENQSRLTHIHRQALDSPIISTAEKFRQVLDGSDFPAIEHGAHGVIHLGRDAFIAELLQHFRIEADCRVLAWTNARVWGYNNIIRNELLGTPPQPIMPGESAIVNTAIVRGRRVVFGTDTTIKAITTETNQLNGVDGYDVLASGEGATDVIFVPHNFVDAQRAIKKLQTIASKLQREKNQAIQAGQPYICEEERKAAWRDFFKAKAQYADIRPPHASTVHKSQGSTFETVFIDHDDIGRNRCHLEVARLLYVAYTRASMTAYITGSVPFAGREHE